MPSKSAQPKPDAPSRTPPARVIILAGFMGSGKSTIGRMLSERLHWTYIDTDKVIEERADKTIPEIFEKDGEEAFRKMEARIARELADMDHCVVSTGGGFMVRAENREAAMRAGRVILLVASPEEIWHRVRQSRNRPLLNVPDPLARIRELLEERKPAYDAIPTRIRTDGRAPQEVAEEILRLMNRR